MKRRAPASTTQARAAWRVANAIGIDHMTRRLREANGIGTADLDARHDDLLATLPTADADHIRQAEAHRDTGRRAFLERRFGPAPDPDSLLDVEPIHTIPGGV